MNWNSELKQRKIKALSNNLSILLGNGDGTFDTAVNYAVGGAPNFIAIGDLNGDTFQDLAVTNVFDDNVSILLGNGDGTFDTAVNYPVGGDGPGPIVIGNFN